MKQTLLSTLALIPLLIGAGIPAHANPSTPTDKPIRFAKVKVQATKLFKEQQADGTYAYKTEVICNVTGVAPVLGADAKNPEIDPANIMTCDTTLKIGPSRLMLMGYVAEQKNVDMFGDGVLMDFKSFGTSVWVQTKSGTFAKSLPPSINAVEPNARMLVTNVWGENLSSDQDGDRVLEERINVIFKFED
ncbi:MAG: hypothetical protein KF767_09295 [Bdellovibrionaceae bacterium]|nr:hypothetical protein [Pseudobdellovibrionaceae bacterium]